MSLPKSGELAILPPYRYAYELNQHYGNDIEWDDDFDFTIHNDVIGYEGFAEITIRRSKPNKPLIIRGAYYRDIYDSEPTVEWDSRLIKSLFLSYLLNLPQTIRAREISVSVDAGILD